MGFLGLAIFRVLGSLVPVIEPLAEPLGDQNGTKKSDRIGGELTLARLLRDGCEHREDPSAEDAAVFNPVPDGLEFGPNPDRTGGSLVHDLGDEGHG